MAAKERTWWVDYSIYIVVRVLIAAIQMVRPQTAYAWADGLAWLVLKLDRKHRQTAERNVEIAFGDKLSAAEQKALVSRMARHFARHIMEVAQIPRRMHISNWKNRMRILMTPEAGAALLSRRPRMILSGHLGSWEMPSVFMGAAGIRTLAIARDLDNPYLHKYLLRFRQYSGQTIISKNDDWERLASGMANGGIVASLADQSAGKRGLFVDFFGKPASTHKATALMALQYDALMIVGYTLRDRDVPGQPYQYVMYSHHVIDPRDYADSADPVREMTRAYLAVLEEGIRLAPEQYFWLHNRWKHEPPAAKPRRKAG